MEKKRACKGDSATKAECVGAMRKRLEEEGEVADVFWASGVENLKIRERGFLDELSRL